MELSEKTKSFCGFHVSVVSFFFLFFYLAVVFNIMCWINVFQSFLSPLKTFRCCRSFVPSLIFRLEILFDYVNPTGFSSYTLLHFMKVFRYSLVFFHQPFREWPSHDNLLFFTRVLHFSAPVFSSNSLFFIIFGHLTPMTWWSSLCWKELVLFSMVFVVVHNSLSNRKILWA